MADAIIRGTVPSAWIERNGADDVERQFLPTEPGRARVAELPPAAG
jgi:hypothetical protein